MVEIHSQLTPNKVLMGYFSVLLGAIRAGKPVTYASARPLITPRSQVQILLPATNQINNFDLISCSDRLPISNRRLIKGPQISDPSIFAVHEILTDANRGSAG